MPDDVVKGVKSIFQLNRQKKELVRETLSILHKLGKVKLTRAYASLGDNGKLVIPLLKALNVTAPIYVGHDTECTPHDAAGVLERGSVNPVADAFFLFDYLSPHQDWLPPDCSALPGHTAGSLGAGPA